MNKTIFVAFLVCAFSLFNFFTSRIFFPRKIEVSKKVIDPLYGEVQRVLDNRCVVCHSCYNSPCQLNLSSYEGVERGANKKDIYDFNYALPSMPTRLFTDTRDLKVWRDKYHFFSVIEPYRDLDPPYKNYKSIMQTMLEKKRILPFEKNGEHDFHSEESRNCPEIRPRSQLYIKKEKSKGVDFNIQKTYVDTSDIDNYFDSRPWAGMPFGFPNLSDHEYETLMTWLENGSPRPLLEKRANPNIEAQIKKWEEFFNKNDFKHRLTSRYIFEHLFQGSLYFSDDPAKFYRLVRAENREGPPLEIPTIRPYDDPRKIHFFYRLSPVASTIVHKIHMTYALNFEKMKRFQELFIDIPWRNLEQKLPSYGKEISSNPFSVFKIIPAKSRYQFLLDNAFFFIKTFIKGPVCNGQAALNVIEDHFFVFFISPDSDITLKDERLLDQISPYLDTPAKMGSAWGSILDFQKFNNLYRELKNNFYDDHRPNGLGVEDIWKGTKEGKQSFFTIFRHFDSASVHMGSIGHRLPKTIWVLDYTIFEDLYYNLVAGYNVFGAYPHHIRTRLYMETSRINAQDSFLQFMPKESRAKIRNTWHQDKKDNKTFYPSNVFFRHFPELYLGDSSKLKMEVQYPFYPSKRETGIKYKTKDFSKELICTLLLNHFSQDIRNMSDKEFCLNIPLKEKLNQNPFLALSGVRGFFIRFFPEIIFLKLKMKHGEGRVFSLIHNNELYNNNFFFNEEERRNKDQDTLTIVPGFIGSYPNFFLEISENQISDFILNVQKIRSERDFKDFAIKYGVRRSDPRFWSVLDWFHLKLKEESETEFGILDLNRYENY